MFLNRIFDRMSRQNEAKFPGGRLGNSCKLSS